MVGELPTLLALDLVLLLELVEGRVLPDHHARDVAEVLLAAEHLLLAEDASVGARVDSRHLGGWSRLLHFRLREAVVQQVSYLSCVVADCAGGLLSHEVSFKINIVENANVSVELVQSITVPPGNP